MKHWKKWGAALLAALTLSAALSGCSSSAPQNKAAYDGGYTESWDAAEWETESPAATEAPAPAPEERGWDTASTAAGGESIEAIEQSQQAQKLIKNVWMSLETRSFDAAMAAIKEEAEALGGYVESSSVNGRKPAEWSDAGRTASLMLRIPAQQLDAFLSKTGELFDVVSQSSDVQNVTTHYYDTAARKKTYETQLERLESLLTDAAELSDVLALETEIARVRYEVESLDTTLRNLDKQVSYSTVTLDIRELNGFERPQAAQQELGERMGNAFAESFRSAGEGLKDFAVFLSSSVPVLLGLAVLALLVVLVCKLVKKSRKKAQKKQQKKESKEKDGASLSIDPKEKAAAEQTEHQKGDQKQ